MPNLDRLLEAAGTVLENDDRSNTLRDSFANNKRSARLSGMDRNLACLITATVIEVVDRYSALGIPRPKLETMCPGQCEGIGFYPLKKEGNYRDLTDAEIKAWDEAEAKEASDDGWHFIKCSECGGTGKRWGSGQSAAARIPGRPAVSAWATYWTRGRAQAYRNRRTVGQAS